MPTNYRVAILCTGLLAAPVMALGDTAPVTAQSQMVTIDYPEEIPLEALVDFTSQTLDIRVLYGDELKNQTAVLRPGHVELPRDRLLDLLRAVLQLRGLTLIESGPAGFYRIVAAGDAQRLTDIVRAGPMPPDVQPERVVTQAIRVPSGDTKAVVSRISGFTSSAKSSIIEVPERGAILVTDYEPVVQRIARLVELVDAAGEPIVTTIVPTQHQPPERLVTPVQTVLQAEMPPVRKGAEVNVLPDIVPGALVLVGPEEGVQRAQSLIAQFDQPREDVRPTRIYTPRYTSAARLRTLVQNVVLAEAGLGKDAVHLYVDDVANSLYITASPPLQEQIRELVVREDQSTPAAARRLRVYRPRNRPVAELLDTLTQLLEEASVQTILSSREAPAEQATVSGPPGPNRPPGPPGPGQVPPIPPAQEPIQTPVPAKKEGRRVVGPDYVLTKDESTNAILAVGTPEFHEELSALIDQLDRRRGQVLIEMTLVAVTLNDTLQVGVELQSLDLGEPWDYLLFSSFGLSELDVVTGQRVLAPGVGVNGVLIGPKDVPFLFQALATHGDTRIISTPRIVVSDHATATLKNVDEAPFTSVNASDTVATTSFAGFEAAGTTLTVTPHLAEGDHLSLKYDLTFSSFSGASSSATIPPPRTTNSFSAELDVPDGYTVIVGGLEIENQSDTVSEVPLVGRIPLLGVLFQNSAASRTRTRIFAFVRPVILRDDQFQDLRFFSERALEKADVESGDFPRDETMWMQ